MPSKPPFHAWESGFSPTINFPWSSDQIAVTTETYSHFRLFQIPNKHAYKINVLKVYVYINLQSNNLL